MNVHDRQTDRAWRDYIATCFTAVADSLNIGPVLGFFKLIPINLFNFIFQLCQLKVTPCIHVKDPAQATVIFFF